MKILCTKKNLNQALLVTSRAISQTNTLPVLNNILLKTNGGRLQVSSTNLEIAINTWVGGKIEEEGELTVPAKLINEYISNLPGDKITISSQNQTLTLEAEKAKTHIRGLAGEEFPLIPKIKEGVFAKIQANEIARAVPEVVFAASFSESQPEISGVLLAFAEKTLTLAATDRYRLAEGRAELQEAVTTGRQVIVPVKTVSELGRIAQGGEVEIFLTEGQIMFRTPEVELTSRLIEGQYPDYKQIIPTLFTTEAEVLRVALLQSIRAASLFATDNHNIELEVSAQNKQLIIKSQSAQTGDSEIRLDAQITGQKNSIIFNYRYILDCLNNLSDEKVVLKLIDSAAPAAICPTNRENYLYIVMPIKL